MTTSTSIKQKEPYHDNMRTNKSITAQQKQSNKDIKSEKDPKPKTSISCKIVTQNMDLAQQSNLDINQAVRLDHHPNILVDFDLS